MICSHVIWVVICFAEYALRLLTAFINIVTDLFDGVSDPVEWFLASLAKIWMTFENDFWSPNAFKSFAYDNPILALFLSICVLPTWYIYTSGFKYPNLRKK